MYCSQLSVLLSATCLRHCCKCDCCALLCFPRYFCFRAGLLDQIPQDRDMAPKKGGGSSSSGSGSGSGVNVCPHCDDMIVLRGYRLGRYPQEAAGIAFAGIVLAGFLALFIASLFGKGTLQRPNKKRATKFGLSWALGCLVM